MIKNITIDELKAIRGKEGLILQGCGGDPSEWLLGINEILREEGILREGESFKDAYAFKHGGCTNILFPMENVGLNIGKLAIWRIKSHETFGGTWLSDFLMNKFRIDIDWPTAESPKLKCPLAGTEGDLIKMLDLATKTLKQHGLHEKSYEMFSRAVVSGSYENALAIVCEYVEPAGEAEMEEEEPVMGMQL